MKRIFISRPLRVVGIAFLVIGLAFFVVSRYAFYGGEGEKNISPSPIASPTPAGVEFCPPIQRTRVEFSVLNDVQSIIEKKSVFRETAQGQEFLLNSVLKTMFAYLAVAEADIPQWAHDIVDKEIAQAKTENRNPDFSVMNNVYNELVKDPSYADLKDPSRVEELIKTMINGMIKALGDPFVSYVPAELWLAGFANNTGRYRGIGVSVGQNSRGEITIQSVAPGTPAERAGLKAGDVVLAVDGKDTSGCSVTEFILRIKNGNPTIQLKIARENTSSLQRDEFSVKVTMEEIKQKALATYPGVELPNNRGSTSKDLPYRCDGNAGSGLACPFADEDGDGTPDVLYIKVFEFSDQAAEDLEYVLSTLDMQRFKAVIVDVRGNPGGLVRATLDMIDYFLPDDSVIFTQEDANGVRTIYRQNKVTYVPSTIPVVIIAGSDSYSGAEVFTAALQQNGRAVLISRDERTGGKGTVNQYFTLRKGEYGALYVSIAKWLTPKGDMIEAQDLDKDGYYEVGGLKPDVRVVWTDEDYTKNGRDVNYDPTLFRALEYIKESLK